MTDELVKRLRGDWFGYEVSLKAIDAMEEAADRIEQLTAERDVAIRWWGESTELTRQARLQYSDEKARAEKAEADNARLRGALTDALTYIDKGQDKMAFNIIRAALKGETP